MVFVSSPNPQGSARCVPTISPLPQQDHIKPNHEPASGQNPTPEKASKPSEDSESGPQQMAISVEDTTLKESTDPKQPKCSPEPDIEESRSKYCPGGFHPVYIGDVYDNRYKVVNKIGYGVYSTVWLVKDLQQQTTDGTEYYAMKVLGARWYGTDKDIFELEILKHLRDGSKDHVGYRHVCHVVNNFTMVGPNGQHVCLVFELMGETLASFGSAFVDNMIPYPVMRRFAIQLVLAIDFAHSRNVIHTDIQPSNIFVKFRDFSLIESEYLTEITIPHQDRTEKDYTPVPSAPLWEHYIGEEDNYTKFDIAIGDWGVASWADRHLTEHIQPVALRAPEVLLKVPWDKNADWWNFGALLPELHRAVRMFSGRVPPDGHYEVKKHLSEIVDLFGPLPRALLEKGDKKLVQEAFDDEGKIKDGYESRTPPLEDEIWTPGLSKERGGEFVSFLRFVMKIDPAERPTGRDMLGHVWLQASSSLLPKEE